MGWCAKETVRWGLYSSATARALIICLSPINSRPAWSLFPESQAEFNSKTHILSPSRSRVRTRAKLSFVSLMAPSMNN